jgi:hypothetical protein
MGKQKGVDTQKDPNAGATMLSEYKKQNPNFSITPDMLPNIQYEQQQFRTGNTFSTLTPAQLQSARTGMSPNFINQTDAYKSYYPQFKVGSQDFGTDVEGYAASKGANQPTTTPLPDSGGDPNKPKSATPSADTPIPLPDYSDQKSRDTYLSKFVPKYGSFVHNRGDTIIHVNEVPVFGTVPIGQSVKQAAGKLGLDPALVYSSMMEEGVSGYFPDKDGNISTGEKDDPDYPVDGFANYGLDNFHGNFKEMAKRGYLPKDMDYKPEPSINENGDKVISGRFKNQEDAVKAKAAYVKFEQDNLEDWAKTKGGNVQLSPTAKQFFTLIAFNGGPGRAHQLINYYKSKGLLAGDKFLSVKPDKAVDPKDSYGNVLPRLQMANLLKQEHLLDNN